ncbi:hypothetical protein PanWU01x14_154110 [Parasponia andersonii]|uniref:Uncharacterized protein n=1 Tax=Parasponia andersonii TaxID=3476 RepID=A0A2P5CGR5_PARAD|nr:hypothetical protein PanWU01x14_154110 [Parasponia andersonii]
MAKEPITTTSPCKAKKITNKNKKRKNPPVFSESEIDAAEQLIQLSGDSDNGSGSSSSKNDNINNNDTDDDVVAESGSTNQAEQQGEQDLFSTASREYWNFSREDDDHDQTAFVGFGPRKHMRFRSLYEIYSFTKPL